MMPISTIPNYGIPRFSYTSAMPNFYMSSSIFNYGSMGRYMLPMLPIIGLGVATPFIFNSNFNFGNIWNGFTTGVSKAWNATKNFFYNTPAVSTKVVNEKFWKDLGYNASKGQKLAKQAAKSAAGGFIGKCARYVKKAIEAVGLGKYIHGVNGKDMARAYGNNKNFRKISGAGIDTSKLPAGCILVFEGGKSGYSQRYGHTEISLGNGTCVSDGKTTRPKPCSYILVPV